MFGWYIVITHVQMIKKLLVVLLGAGLCGCAKDPASLLNDGPEPTGLDSEVLSVAGPLQSDFQDATQLDVYLMSMVEDVQSLAYALRLIDPAVSEHNKFLKDVIVDMLDLKLLSLAQFLSSTENHRVIRSACTVLKYSTEDIFNSTNSCTETVLCERSHDVALVCVAEGHATEEEIAIPREYQPN